jgi:hypothetical protein
LNSQNEEILQVVEVRPLGRQIFPLSTTIEINRSNFDISSENSLAGLAKKKTVNPSNHDRTSFHYVRHHERPPPKGRLPPPVTQSCAPASCPQAPTAHQPVVSRFPAAAAAP